MSGIFPFFFLCHSHLHFFPFPVICEKNRTIFPMSGKRIEPIGSLSIIDNGAKGLSQLVQFTKVSPRVQLLIWEQLLPFVICLQLGTFCNLGTMAPISVMPTKRY